MILLATWAITFRLAIAQAFSEFEFVLHDQKVNMASICMMRVYVFSELIVPNAELVTVVLGGPKFGWLNALSISHRSCKFKCSRSLIFRKKSTSVVFSPEVRTPE